MNYIQPVILTGKLREQKIAEIERLKAIQRLKERPLRVGTRARAAVAAKGYAKRQDGAGRGT